MNKHKMKGVRAVLNELVNVKERTSISIFSTGRCFTTISGARYLTVSRGKHRGLPGRGMSTPRFTRDDLHFELFSTPPSILSYGSKQFTKELADEFSASRPRLGDMYKEKVCDDAVMLPKGFFKTETPIHELGLRCMEVAGMLPKGGLHAPTEDAEHGIYLKP